MDIKEIEKTVDGYMKPYIKNGYIKGPSDDIAKLYLMFLLQYSVEAGKSTDPIALLDIAGTFDDAKVAAHAQSHPGSQAAVLFDDFRHHNDIIQQDGIIVSFTILENERFRQEWKAEQ